MSNTTLKLLPPLTVSTNNNGSSDTYITTQSETLSLPPQPFSTAGKFGAYTFNSQGLLTGRPCTSRWTFWCDPWNLCWRPGWFGYR